MNETQESFNSSSNITAQGIVYHYTDANVPTQQIKQSYDSAYVHATDEIERATIRGSNVSPNQNQGTLIDLAAATSQKAIPYA